MVFANIEFLKYVQHKCIFKHICISGFDEDRMSEIERSVICAVGSFSDPHWLITFLGKTDNGRQTLIASALHFKKARRAGNADVLHVRRA